MGAGEAQAETATARTMNRVNNRVQVLLFMLLFS
jgi:hypothetical protein